MTWTYKKHRRGGAYRKLSCHQRIECKRRGEFRLRNDLNSPFGTYALLPRAARVLRLAQSMPVNFLGQRAALALRKLVRMSRQPVVDATVEGLRLRLYMDDNVGERKFLFMPNFFDSYERTLLRQHLRPGDTFLDIGANVGIYSMLAAALVGAMGKVLAIEPNPFVMERLRFNAGLNSLEAVIVEVPFGVTDQAGDFDLNLDPSNLGGSSLVIAHSDTSIKVPCLPLHAIVGNHRVKEIAALKIDIEGAEDRALGPFFRNADRIMYPKLIILERSSGFWKEDLHSMLTSVGYSLLNTTRMNTVWTLDRAAHAS